MDNYDIYSYLLSVLHYTTGWMLRTINNSKTERESIRSHFRQFTSAHSMSSEKAKTLSLPTALTEQREII